MTEKTLTTENIKPALDALRGELAPWPVVAKKQDRLNTAQLNAANSGITSSLVAQIIANTAAIRALESAITGTGLRALVVSSLPAIGTQGILYIVPVTTYDPETDADVVNYSNEYIWIVAPDAPETEGYYEQVGQTGIVINNGQLNITVNGTSVGTFTANQSGDTTAAITVPTNADYVDRTTDQTVAGVKTFSSTINGTAAKAIADEDGTSIKTGYGKLAGNNTWTGFNIYEQAIRIAKTSGDSEIEIVNKNIDITSNATTEMDDIRFMDKNGKITGGLRVTYNNAQVQNSLSARSWSSDGTAYSNVAINIVSNYQSNAAYISITNDFLPVSTNSIRLGNASYQWSSVYAQSYYYNGTAWGLDKANVWTQTNYFTKGLIINSDAAANTQSALSGSKIRQIIFNDSSNSNYFFRLRQYVDATSSRMQFNAQGFDSNNQAYSASFVYRINSSGNTELYPGDNSQSLGISTNKWKTLNGVNPGALSLPDIAQYIDLTSSIPSASLSGNTDINLSSYITSSGWLSIVVPDTNADDFVFVQNGSSLNNRFFMSGTRGNGFISLMMPINMTGGVNAKIKASSVTFCKFYPCLGNV